MKIMVSACLLGENCKYDGGNNRNEALLEMLAAHEIIPVCPEVAGGLAVPRIPVEIVNGRAVNRIGEDVDLFFRKGAEKTLEIVERENPGLIILQPRSPSCGVNEIYDGTFTGKKIPGHGIFAGMVISAGYNVIDAEDLASVQSGVNHMKQNSPEKQPEKQEQLKKLYLDQKKTLDIFLANGAITKEQYDKSLGDLTKKMGMENKS